MLSEISKPNYTGHYPFLPQNLSLICQYVLNCGQGRRRGELRHFAQSPILQKAPDGDHSCNIMKISNPLIEAWQS